MSAAKKVWFIDEDDDQRNTYKDVLQEIFTVNMEILSIEPKNKISDMKFVIDDPDTSSIIIDERLKDTGKADFFGIDLALYFRELNDKMPIYILTNYSADSKLVDNQWSVEYIISKDELANDLVTVKARMQRNISLYFDLIGEREIRFNELLRKSICESLTGDEIKELEDLQYIRIKGILADEIILSKDLEKRIDEQKRLLKAFDNHKEDKKYE